MRVIVTGGTGMIGRALARSLTADGHEVIALSRAPDRATGMPAGARVERWDGRTGEGWWPLADGADAIVNLAGENIGAGRWTAERKRRIVDSRVNAGRAVVDAVHHTQVKPRVVIQASGVNYYGPHGDEKISEQAAQGSDWLAGVAGQWEASTADVEALGIRRAVMRSGVVLTPTGGALPRMMLPFRFFVGGPIGSGRQWLSWLHLADAVAAIRFLIDHEQAFGIFNVTAPEPVTNRQFAAALGRAMRRPALIPVPAPAVRLLFGEMSTTVLDGLRVLPQRLTGIGFQFRYPTVDAALQDLLR